MSYDKIKNKLATELKVLNSELNNVAAQFENFDSLQIGCRFSAGNDNLTNQNKLQQ